MPRTKRLDKNKIISLLYSAIVEGVLELSHVPGLLQQILEENLWQERVIPSTGELVKFEFFIDFVQTSPPAGLGTDFETLWQFCADDPQLLNLLDQAAQRQRGAPKKNKNVDRSINNDNIHNNQPRQLTLNSLAADIYQARVKRAERPSGTSKQAGLRQLRKHTPELHAKVLAGELSINAALIQAGLRTKQITVFVNPQRAARTLTKAFSEEELAELGTLLIASLPENSQQVADKLKQALSQEDYKKVVAFLELLKRRS
jgi:hypothetical protein